MSIDRRVFLGASLAMTVCLTPSLSALAARAAISHREDTEILKRDLSRFLADIFDPHGIGEEVLAAHPGKIDATRLLAALDEALAPAPASGRVLRWQRRRRREFEREDIVVVDGWIMAHAEAEACALLRVL